MTAQAVWKSEDTVKQIETMQHEVRDLLGHRAPSEPQRDLPSADELRRLAGYGAPDSSPALGARSTKAGSETGAP